MNLQYVFEELEHQRIFINTSKDYLNHRTTKRRSKERSNRRKPKFDEDIYVAYIDIDTPYDYIQECLNEEGNVEIRYTCVLISKSLFIKTLADIIKHSFTKFGIDTCIEFPNKKKWIHIDIVIDKNDVGWKTKPIPLYTNHELENEAPKVDDEAKCEDILIEDIETDKLMLVEDIPVQDIENINDIQQNEPIIKMLNEDDLTQNIEPEADIQPIDEFPTIEAAEPDDISIDATESVENVPEYADFS